MEKDLRQARIYIAGHTGLVGSSLVKGLTEYGCKEVIVRSSKELDLRNQQETHDFLQSERPDIVILCAAKVGGILANKTYPAEFISTNLIIEHNVIWGSHLANVGKLIFCGSSCVYPRITPQPISEEALLSSYLEPTNAPFAIAKIAGIMLCNALSSQYGRKYCSIMLPNIYGPNDNFDLESSHVVPALIRKFHEALPDKPITLWGSGTPKREFLHSSDVANACIFLLEQEETLGHINVGTGESISIKDLALLIQNVVGHQGKIDWDVSMPDGFPEKTMSVSKIRMLGWKHNVSLKEGLQKTYEHFSSNYSLLQTSGRV